MQNSPQLERRLKFRNMNTTLFINNTPRRNLSDSSGTLIPVPLFGFFAFWGFYTYTYGIKILRTIITS